MSSAENGPTIFSVSELNKAVRDLLEHSFGLLWVEGEVSNLARPRSGHVYFSLKDGDTQVRCALFRNKARLLRVALSDGAQIRVRARVSLYAARGDYQLLIEHAEDAGAGALKRAFEQLRAKLDAEGLFAVERKRALPVAPARIGVITSATGAAIRDVLSVVSRRYPLGALRIYAVPVQGEAAAPAIVRALSRASERADCDVLLLVRGGGALEDLWAFNEESVARALAACPIAVVSGIGHEVDMTIADLVADVRAATPSAAAELVCPDLGTRAKALAGMRTALEQRTTARIDQSRRRFAGLEQRLTRQHPVRRLQIAAQRLDEAEQRLARVTHGQFSARRRQFQWTYDRLKRASPSQRVYEARIRLVALSQRLDRAGPARLQQSSQRLRTVARALHSVSPLQTLERGYAIARDAQGSLLRDVRAVSVGETVAVDLARGRLDCEVRAQHARRSLGDNTNNK